MLVHTLLLIYRSNRNNEEEAGNKLPTLLKHGFIHASHSIVQSHPLKISSLFEMSRILFCLAQAATVKGYLMLK